MFQTYYPKIGVIGVTSFHIHYAGKLNFELNFKKMAGYTQSRVSRPKMKIPSKLKYHPIP